MKTRYFLFGFFCALFLVGVYVGISRRAQLQNLVIKNYRPKAQFQGNWIKRDKKSIGPDHLKIEILGGELKIETWYDSRGKPVSMGIHTGNLSVDGKSVSYGKKESYVIRKNTLRFLEPGILELKAYSKFIDKSDRGEKEFTYLFVEAP